MVTLNKSQACSGQKRNTIWKRRYEKLNSINENKEKRRKRAVK